MYYASMFACVFSPLCSKPNFSRQVFFTWASILLSINFNKIFFFNCIFSCLFVFVFSLNRLPSLSVWFDSMRWLRTQQKNQLEHSRENTKKNLLLLNILLLGYICCVHGWCLSFFFVLSLSYPERNLFLFCFAVVAYLIMCILLSYSCVIGHVV